MDWLILDEEERIGQIEEGVSLTLLAIAFPRVGSVAHVLAGFLLSVLLFDLSDTVAMLFVIAPMLILGALAKGKR